MPGEAAPEWPTGVPMRSERVTSSCIIHATIGTVWNVLTDLERYGEWNPFILKLTAPAGALTPGSQMLLEARSVSGGVVRSPERVTRVTPPTARGDGSLEAVWIYAFAGFAATIGAVRGSRIQTLRQDDGQPVVYTSEQDFSGWGLGFVPLAHVRWGFDAHAAALKSRAEAPIPEPDATWRRT